MTVSAATALADQSLCSPNTCHFARDIQPHPIRLGILASGSGSNFEAIAQAIAQGHLAATVEVVICNNPEAKVLERSQRYNIPTQVLNHRDYANREALDQAIVETLKAYSIDLLVMAGWMRVATPLLLQAFPHTLNIHPSLLPSFKGIRAVEQALAAGVKITGCTVHWVVPAVDSGPIVMQAAVPILPDDTAETLHRRIQVQEHRILVDSIAIAAAQISSEANKF